LPAIAALGARALCPDSIAAGGAPVRMYVLGLFARSWGVMAREPSQKELERTLT
jgi:hypothetical protein